MALGNSRSWRSVVLLLTGASVLLGCAVSQTATKKRAKRAPSDPGDTFYEEGIPGMGERVDPDHVNENSSAFGASERPARPSNGPSGSADAAPVIDDDAGPLPKTYCGPPAAGDLAIVELMISSRSGSGDSGEWIEIKSTRDCWLRLQGVAVESPRGTAAPNIATITDDFELPPQGTFVVASSADPEKNHGLAGKVIAWEASDVLKNDGDTLTVKLGELTIDTLTYPAFNNLTPGRALSFPGDCAWSDRSNWARWSLTFAEYSPGFKGSPNTENADVACF